MEHFFRIAFWIVTLFGCTQTLPLSHSNINFMRENVLCPSDSTFYAPTNVKGQCITTALDCVKTELNGTVRQECTDSNEDIDLALDFLNHVIQIRSGKGHTLTNSKECSCETQPQTPFSEFLDKMESLVQLHNAAALR